MEKTKIEQVLLPVAVEKQQNREEKVRREFWPKFRSFAAQLPFAEDVAAAYFCAVDKKTPLKVRGTLLAAGASGGVAGNGSLGCIKAVQPVQLTTKASRRGMTTLFC